MSYARKAVIELDELPSYNRKISKILKDNNITNVSKLAVCSLSDVVALGIDSDIGQRLISEAEIMMRKKGVGFITGAELLKTFNNRETLTTGCSELDEILDGGLQTQRLYEFYGPNRVGKTNLLHQLICTAVLPKKDGGLESPVVYLDAEGNFSFKKLSMISSRFGLDPQEVMNNIRYFKIENSAELEMGVEKDLFPTLEESGARAIFLDSITINVREEYRDKSSLPLRQGILAKVARYLKNAAQAFNAVAVIINQVTTDPSTSATTYVGGNVLGHETQVRIAIKFIDNEPFQREFFIEKAVDLPQESCILEYTEFGFKNRDENSIEY
ncbi:MAG: hypothetical protein ACTSO9_12100 [Candidatus Helarchaeota archaeon]